MAKILVDNRERNLELLERLSDLGIEMSFAQLPVGDYIISDRICLERKSMRDLESSIMNSRLFDQLERLSESFPKPMLIIEGDESEFMLNDRVLLGTILSAYLDYGVQVLRSASAEESAEIIAGIAKHEQKHSEHEPRIVGIKRAYSISEWQVLVLSSIPGVGSKLANSLMKHFKTIRNVALASTEELMQVDKIGKKKAELIQRVLNEEFSSGTGSGNA
ncbi:MAG: ERCC4 domain-containing protein [Candidatus Micrarchaeia archaeon]